MQIDFKKHLDNKFIIENIKIKDIADEAIEDGILDNEKNNDVEEVLSDTVTVDYNELKNLLSNITSSTSLSDETNSKIADYITKIELQRSTDGLKSKLESIQMKLFDGIKTTLDEATAAATKKATGRFSAFMNGMYGSVLAIEKNVGMDNYYADAFKKQAVFVPIMNVITNFLRNILESNDRTKLLAMLKTGQLSNPIVLAKYAYTLPAKVKLQDGEKMMFVPFTKEFVDSKNSVTLPDYAYKIRPFLEEGYFAFDDVDGIKLRQPLNSPFIKSFLEMLLNKQDAQTTIQQAQQPEAQVQQSNDEQPQNADEIVGEEVVRLKDFNGLNIYNDIIEFLTELQITPNEEVTTESIGSASSNYYIDMAIQLTEQAKQFDDDLSNIIRKRSELYDSLRLAGRRIDDYLLTSDMRKTIKDIVSDEDYIHTQLMQYSEKVELFVKGLP